MMESPKPLPHHHDLHDYIVSNSMPQSVFWRTGWLMLQGHVLMTKPTRHPALLSGTLQLGHETFARVSFPKSQSQLPLGWLLQRVSGPILQIPASKEHVLVHPRQNPQQVSNAPMSLS